MTQLIDPSDPRYFRLTSEEIMIDIITDCILRMATTNTLKTGNKCNLLGSSGLL